MSEWVKYLLRNAWTQRRRIWRIFGVDFQRHPKRRKRKNRETSPASNLSDVSINSTLQAKSRGAEKRDSEKAAIVQSKWRTWLGPDSQRQVRARISENRGYRSPYPSLFVFDTRFSRFSVRLFSVRSRATNLDKLARKTSPPSSLPSKSPLYWKESPNSALISSSCPESSLRNHRQCFNTSSSKRKNWSNSIVVTFKVECIF